MTLPLKHETPRSAHPVRPRLRPEADRRSAPGSESSPANRLLSLLEEADIHAQTRVNGAGRARRGPHGEGIFKAFASGLLVLACVLLFGSVALLSFETLKGSPAAPADRPALEFSELRSRYVSSSEGPALELSGIVMNAGGQMVPPEVVLQLAGKRLAIEEPLQLGGAALPPGAERPFTVRLLLPEGTETVSLLPPSEGSRFRKSMPLVSPAWTSAGQPG